MPPERACAHYENFEPGRLYAVVDGVGYCAECWKKAGRPFPRRPPSAIELEQAEIRTHERMNERGGTDRHLVRKGIA